MKTFLQYILEAVDSCNSTPEGTDCPIHGVLGCNEIKPHLSVAQIAKKHKVDISFVRNQLKMGVKVEHEHTKNSVLATDIALQHLDEFPDYYTRLTKMEADARKEYGMSAEVKEDYSRLTANGYTYDIILIWKGQYKTIQIFSADIKKPTRADITFEVRKIYPDANVLHFQPTKRDPIKPLILLKVG